MQPFTTAAHEDLRTRVRAFAGALPGPGRGGDPGPDQARVAVQELAAQGLLHLCVPERQPGAAQAVQALPLVVVREEIARVSGFHDAMFAVQGLSSHPIAAAGSPEIRARWLPALASGEAVAAFALTEPEAGSDAAAMTTQARREGGGYVLDGHKTFISNAGVADVIVVFARLEDPPGAAKSRPRFVAFAVPGDSDGLSSTPIALMAPHVIGTVRLRGVRVPESARLGDEGEGLALCLAALQVYRPTVGAAACGMARRALDETIQQVSIRKQFGGPLAEQAPVRFTVAEMGTALESARLMVYRAAWLHDHGEAQGQGADEAARASSMAKLHATECAHQIVDQAVQLHGARGLVRGSVVEALYRQVRALRIYEGASEIQKLIIARGLLPRPGRGGAA